MTAMLIQWSDTVKGRIIVVLISGIVFGVSHFNGGLFSVLITGILGIGFSAVYLYSKNLMICMLLHALYDVPAHLSHWIAELSENTLHHVLDDVQAILMYAVIPLFALFLCVKAKPFDCNENEMIEERRFYHNRDTDGSPRPCGAGCCRYGALQYRGIPGGVGRAGAHRRV